jgi:outer membrane protein assembly factor BamD (BamD/ComL family)
MKAPGTGTVNALKQILLVVILCALGGNINAQNYDKLLKKGKYKQAHKTMDRALVSNPDDVKTLYFYSRYYRDTLNPDMNIYKAYLKAMDAYSAYDNKASKRQKARLDKDGYNSAFLIQNILDICRDALRDIDKSPSVFKYEDYLSKYKNGEKYFDLVLQKRDSFVLKKAEETHTEEAYQNFIDKYPNSVLIKKALHMRDQVAYDNALSYKTVEALETFISKYPASEYRYSAKLKMDSTAFAFSEIQNTETAYEQFIAKYPDALQVGSAKIKLENAVYLTAINGKSQADLDRYLSRYPNGKHVSEIEKRKSAWIFNSVNQAHNINAYYKFINDYPQSDQVNRAYDSILSIAKKAHDDDAIHTLLNNETNPDRKLRLWNIFYEVYTFYDGMPAIESFEQKYPENPLKDRIAKDKEVYGKGQ